MDAYTEVATILKAFLRGDATGQLYRPLPDDQWWAPSVQELEVAGWRFDLFIECDEIAEIEVAKAPDGRVLNFGMDGAIDRFLTREEQEDLCLKLVGVLRATNDAQLRVVRRPAWR